MPPAAFAALCDRTVLVVGVMAVNYAKRWRKKAVIWKKRNVRRKKTAKNLANQNKCITFAAAFSKRMFYEWFKVPWMSGLVNGLQNRLQQFESARHLPSGNLSTEVPAFHLSFFISHFPTYLPTWHHFQHPSYILYNSDLMRNHFVLFAQF